MSPKVRRRTVAERFWSKVAGGDVSTCWQWTGASNRRTGYGHFSPEKGKYVMAHRFAFEVLRVEIPAGLQIDHLCRTRLCVNPWHMEPVTPRVNVMRSDNAAMRRARQTHCLNGHELSGENIYHSPSHAQRRRCRVCHNARTRKYAAARAAQTGGAS